MKTLWLVLCSLLALTGGLMLRPPTAAADAGTKIAAYENWIRYDCDLRDPEDLEQARKNFRAVVNMATSSPRDEVYARFANLADIEGATFLDEQGELVIWGPKINDANFMPPLLWDDFVIALRIVHAGEDPSVSIGTYSGRIPTEADMEESQRTGIIPVEYGPPLLGGTHAGAVFFEADRWLKTLSIGVDNFTGRRVYCPVRGYRSTRDRASVTVDEALMRPFGRNWFMPDEPKVAVDGYSMRFGGYKMRVKNEIYTDDPAPEKFAQQVEDDFDEYCRHYPVFRELVRLFKIVQVARWYDESQFPVDPILDAYQPLPIRTMATTKQKRARIGERVVGNRVYWNDLVGGVVFSAPNHYVPANVVPAQSLNVGMPTTWSAPAFAAPAAPVRYGSLPASAPTPTFVTQVIERRPTAQTAVWTIPVQGLTLLAAAIPVPKGAIHEEGLSVPLLPAPRLAPPVPYRPAPHSGARVAPRVTLGPSAPKLVDVTSPVGPVDGMAKSPETPVPFGLRVEQPLPTRGCRIRS